MSGKPRTRKKVVEYSNRKRLAASALGIVAAAGLAVGVNMLADRLAPRARIDLTEQNLYTLASGTEQVLAGLKDPITLRLFYSRKLGGEVPSYGAYADRVREMLAEYVALSDGEPRAMMMRQSSQFGQPAVVMTQIRQFFAVKDVALDAQAIDPDVQVLLV